MLYLTCTMISSVDLAHYGVSRAKDWVSVDCGTITVFRLSNCAIPFSLQHMLILYMFILQTNTFQAVLATDYVKSFVIFLYEKLEWGPAVVMQFLRQYFTFC